MSYRVMFTQLNAYCAKPQEKTSFRPESEEMPKTVTRRDCIPDCNNSVFNFVFSFSCLRLWWQFFLISGIPVHSTALRSLEDESHSHHVHGDRLLSVLSLRLDPELLHSAHWVLEFLWGGRCCPHHSQLLLKPVDGLCLGHHWCVRLQVLPLHDGTAR